MSHFDTPSSGIQFKGPLGGNAHIRGDEGVPGAVALLVEEELAKGAVGIVRRRLDGEEREQDKQFHQLNEGELAVRILNRTNRFSLDDEPVHHSVYRIDCLAGVIMFEKVFEFRNYLSIFVHG